MKNYPGELANYPGTCWTILLRPIYFYTRLKEESWREGALTSLLITSWLLALAATLIVFLLQYLPIGSTLVEGVKGARLFLVLPVMLTLAFVFFVITLFILAGAFVAGFLSALYALGWLLHYVFLALGGKGSLNRMIQDALYSGVVLLAGWLIFALMLLLKYGGMDFTIFRYGFNTIFFFAALYAYGLWAVAGRKVYQVPKWKAFLGALVPLLALLIFGVLFDKIALPRLEPWIS